LLFYLARLAQAVQLKGVDRLSSQFGTNHRATFDLEVEPHEAYELLVSYLQENYKKFKPKALEPALYRLVIVNKMKWFDSRNQIDITIESTGQKNCRINVSSKPFFPIVVFDGGSNARIMNAFEDFLSTQGTMISRSSTLF
ncbi:MAG: hypothetical protein R3245_10725, partial [Kiloniellales bacterium]|nr:hypothetical protein [Kiloniellales bacterium]